MKPQTPISRTHHNQAIQRVNTAILDQPPLRLAIKGRFNDFRGCFFGVGLFRDAVFGLSAFRCPLLTQDSGLRTQDLSVTETL